MSHELWRESLKRLRAIAQTGLTYSKDPYDLERYEEIEAMALSLLARLLDSPPEVIRSVYLPEKGYPTPKIDVRAGVFRDDRILLVRETADGRWTLPGGWGMSTKRRKRALKERSGKSRVSRSERSDWWRSKTGTCTPTRQNGWSASTSCSSSAS